MEGIMAKQYHVNPYGYIERKVRIPHSTNHAKPNSKGMYRNWWIVKQVEDKERCYGLIRIGKIYFPEKHVGKKIRIKIEVIDGNK